MLHMLEKMFYYHCTTVYISHSSATSSVYFLQCYAILQISNKCFIFQFEENYFVCIQYSSTSNYVNINNK